MENLWIILLKSRQVFTSSSFSHSILNTDLVHGARIFIFPSVDLVSSTSLEASWWQTLFYTLYSGIEADLKLYWFLLTYPFLNNFQAFLSKSHPLIVGLPASSPPFFWESRENRSTEHSVCRFHFPGTWPQPVAHLHFINPLLHEGLIPQEAQVMSE